MISGDSLEEGQIVCGDSQDSEFTILSLRDEKPSFVVHRCCCCFFDRRFYIYKDATGKRCTTPGSEDVLLSSLLYIGASSNVRRSYFYMLNLRRGSLLPSASALGRSLTEHVSQKKAQIRQIPGIQGCSFCRTTRWRVKAVFWPVFAFTSSHSHTVNSRVIIFEISETTFDTMSEIRISKSWNRRN